MPITIKERPEVLTEASLLASEPPLLIRSNAVGLLTHELRRYCNREVSGRSFLIAGHRGAGKTTLVLNACQEIFKESIERRVPLRPLLVMLQGPNLLPNEEDELPVAEDGDMTKVAPKKISPMENVLRQITLGLYRALAREVSQAFRRHAVSLASGPKSAASVPTGELVEFAAALELELDEYPGKSRLRQFWEAAGALETGVLWPVRPVASGGTVSTTIPGRQPGQGLRELVALCSACEAYRRISGTFTSKQEDKQGAKAAEERKIEADLKGKEIWGPGLPVLAGALAGTGVWAMEVATGPQAALAGAFVAIASAFAFKYASSRSRERSATREDLFIPDLSVATLDRVLPVLIDRLRAAGLAPVFVIDELDKVERLSIRIPEMVRRLKKLVAENAFFCFLTDRTYYEQMRKREVKNPYSIEHTYFTHQLFIIFRHRDLHNFLKEVLELPDTPSESPQSSTGVLAEREAQSLTKLERDDAAVLPYLLLYAARMHSIDLRRELMQIRGDQGHVTLTAGALQASRRYGLELQMQVAIETLLDEDDMERELDRHPEFRRLAHDALYYLAERWEDPDETLDLHSAESLAKFKDYLCSRMVTDPPDDDANGSEPIRASHYPASEANGIKPVHLNGPEGELPGITESDLEFLWTRVRDLATLLSSHQALLTRARLRGIQASATAGTSPLPAVAINTPPPFPEVVLKAVSLDPLLSPIEGKEHIYRWCWYPAGRLVYLASSIQTLGPKNPIPSWREQIEFIGGFAAVISKLTGRGGVTFADLGTNLNIISTSPPWKNVEESMGRLTTLAATASYAGEAEDADTVAKFDALLRRSIATVAYALCAAHVLKATGKPEAATNVAQRLATISSTLSLRDASEAAVAKLMKELFDQLHARLNIDPAFSTPPEVNDKDGIAPWENWVRRASIQIARSITKGAFNDLTDIKKRAWDHWHARFTSREFDPVSVDSLICAQGGFGPASYLTAPIEQMTVQKWSGAFFGAFNPSPPNSEEEQPPMWLAFAALSYLGFGDRVASLRERSTKGDQLSTNEELSSRWKAAISSWPLEFGAPAAKRSALVLRRGEVALVGAWRPDPAFAVITLSRLQAEALRSTERLADLKIILYPEMVMFDLAPMPATQAEDTQAKQIEPQLPPDELERTVLNLVPLRPATPLGIPIVIPTDLSPLPTGYFCIINPKSSEELFRALTQQEEEVAARTLPLAPAP
jgi:hypothetical protein